jgi:hypothetical protein
MLPSVIDVATDGRLYVAEAEVVPDRLRVRFLKMLLAGADLPESGLGSVIARSGLTRLIGSADCDGKTIVKVLSAVYLAHVLMSARQLMDRDGIFRGDKFVINMGAPLASSDESSRRVFAHVLSVAFRWALGTGVPTSLNDAIIRWHADQRLPNVPDCHVRPEVEAAYEPLIRNRSAKPDVQVLVDVGGGTVEVVASQYVAMPETDRLNGLAGGFRSVGVEILANALEGGALSEREERVLTQSAIFHDLGGIAKGRALHQQFKELVGTTVSLGVKRGGTEWSNRQLGPITIYMTGGGGAAPVYRAWLADIWRRQLYGLDLRLHRFSTLPVPQDVEPSKIPAEMFHRFSIAYGLSVPITGLEVGLPAEFAGDEGWRMRREVAGPRSAFGVDYADSKDAWD